MSLLNNRVARYCMAVTVMLLALLVRMALVPVIGSGTLYITFFPAMAIIAVTLGAGPGLLGCAFGIVMIEYLLIEPAGHISLTVSFAVRSAIMLLSSFYIGRVGDKLRAARVQAKVEEETARSSEAVLRRQLELIDPMRSELITREMQRVLRESKGVSGAPPRKSDVDLRGVPAIAGAFAVFVGLLVLGGWMFDVAVLKSVLPGLVTMKANTALCFLLVGVALALCERRALRLVCTTLVFMIAGITLIQYAAGIDFGIDSFLFQEPVDFRSVPGRMAQVTTLCFILSGVSLLLIGGKVRAALWAQQAAALAVGILGLMALLGYVYQIPQFYALPGFTSMALHTAITLLVLGTGLLFARADGVLRILMLPGSGTQFARRILPAVLIVPVIIGWLRIMGEKTGLFDSSVSIGLVVLAMIFSFAALVWWTASAIARADAERQEVETQLRSQAQLMDQAVEPLIVREINGVIHFWNRGAAAFYGWSAIEAIGQRIHVLLRTEGQSLENIETQLERTGHWEGELTHITRAGRRVLVESRKTAIRADDGRILILESNHDITERRQAEQALQENEAKYRVLFQNMAEGFALYELLYDAQGNPTDWRILEVNDAYTRNTGLSREQVLGRCISELFPEAISEYLPIFSKVVSTQSPVEFDTYARHIGRHQHVVSFPAGACRFANIVEDITERKQAEQALRDSRSAALTLMQNELEVRKEAECVSAELRKNEERLKRAQEMAHLGSWELDLIHNRLVWSDEVYRIFGLRPQEFGATYEAFLERIHPNDRAAVDAAYSNSLRENLDSYDIEHRIVRKGTGEVRVVHERCQHLRNAEGRLIRSSGMVHDITERTLAERKLRLAANELARSNKDLEQFAHIASHDLKEPLRMVTGFTGLLKDYCKGSLDAKAEEYISFAADAAVRMQRLVDDLLAYSRAGQGKALELANVAVAVDLALKNLRVGIEESGAVITRDPMPRLNGHSLGLMQVFQNLVGNAIKFRKPGTKPEIHIGAKRIVKDDIVKRIPGDHYRISDPSNSDSHWLFTIKDNGIGMDPQFADRIFKIFQRLHTREEYPGSGVGLAICKKIVEQHGGMIWVDSKPGEGSIFSFTIPDIIRNDDDAC